MPALSGVLETCLYVTDVQESIAFYDRVLGLRPEFVDERAAALDVRAGQVLLLFRRQATLAPMETAGGVIPPHDGSGELHIAFAVPAEALAEWESRLAAEGVAIESRVEWARGGVSIYFRDPDRHLIELATPGVWGVY